MTARKVPLLRVRRRVIWAVNPFDKESKVHRSSVEALKEFAADPATEVLPIYVWGTTLFEGAQKLTHDELEKQRVRGQEKVDRLLGPAARVLRCRPLRLLAKPYASLKEGASHLVRYARKVGAELIVVSTHARKGPARWFVGSFAETLSKISDVPLLITNPKWRPQPGKQNVLVPVDFSRQSIGVFRRIVEMARARDWSLTVFHHVSYSFYPADESSLIAWDVYERAFRAEARAKTEEGKKLTAWGRKRKVKVKVIIDTTRPAVASDAVLDLIAREKRQFLFVALASHTKALARVFVGSTTQSLIRNSPIPVWVIHPVENASTRSKSPRVSPSAGKATRRPTVQTEFPRFI